MLGRVSYGWKFTCCNSSFREEGKGDRGVIFEKVMEEFNF